MEEATKEIELPVSVDGGGCGISGDDAVEVLEVGSHFADILDLLLTKVEFGFVLKDFIGHCEDLGRHGSSMNVDNVLLHCDHVLRSQFFACLLSVLHHFCDALRSGSRGHSGADIELRCLWNHSIIRRHEVSFLRIDDKRVLVERHQVR